MKKFILALLVVVLATGCATFNKVVMNDELMSQLSVEASTARVLHEHPDWKNGTIAITERATKAIDSKIVVSLEDLESFIRNQVSWYYMIPEEQALVSTLITQVRKDLESSFLARGVSNPSSKMVEVRKVIQWINETARRQK